MDHRLIPVIGIERLRMQTDGTGVRTLIGTHGCPLRCQYCLNPQSWNGAKKPTLYTPEQLFQKVFIDNIYFQATNGGITIGGGEPLLYIDALSPFVDMCPNNWNLWIETALNVSCDSVIQASNLFDHFLIDIKTTNPSIYKAYTGKELKPALENLLLLQELVGNAKITVRVPQIPGFVSKEQQEETAELLQSLGFDSLDLFIYRTTIKK